MPEEKPELTKGLTPDSKSVLDLAALIEGELAGKPHLREKFNEMVKRSGDRKTLTGEWSDVNDTEQHEGD
jgi:hypothetical protein